MMELYTAGTGNGQRAAIAVNECGVTCNIHVLNLGQGDQKAADYLKINPTARIPTLIDPEGPGGKPLTVTQSWAFMMYLCEKSGKFLPADPIARVRMFQWMAEGAADYASVNQTIFFLGARMPETVPASAIKFYEDRFVNLWRFADEQLAKTAYLACDEITAADLAVYPIYAGRKALPDNAGLKRVHPVPAPAAGLGGAWLVAVSSRGGVGRGLAPALGRVRRRQRTVGSIRGGARRGLPRGNCGRQNRHGRKTRHTGRALSDRGLRSAGAGHNSQARCRRRGDADAPGGGAPHRGDRR